MLVPSIGELMKTIPSRYLLINITAQRAREIAESAQEHGIILTEKPVKLAINEIANGTLIGRVREEYDFRLPVRETE